MSHDYSMTGRNRLASRARPVDFTIFDPFDFRHHLTPVGIGRPIYSRSPPKVLNTLPTHPILLVGIDTPKIVRQTGTVVLVDWGSWSAVGLVKRARTKMSNVTFLLTSANPRIEDTNSPPSLTLNYQVGRSWAARG